MLFLFLLFFIMCCEEMITKTYSDSDLFKERKYFPKVYLLRPKGFSVSIEGKLYSYLYLVIYILRWYTFCLFYRVNGIEQTPVIATAKYLGLLELSLLLI